MSKQYTELVCKYQYCPWHMLYDQISIKKQTSFGRFWNSHHIWLAISYHKTSAVCTYFMYFTWCNSDITSVSYHLNLLTIPMFVQQFVQANSNNSSNKLLYLSEGNRPVTGGGFPFFWNSHFDKASMSWCSNIIQHIEAETKWPPFRRRYFQTHFREWKC